MSILARLQGRDAEVIGPFRVALKPEDPPEFERSYTAALPNGAKIQIEMRTSAILGRTDSYGTLTQRNGRYVLFNIHRIADEILDRELAPIVQDLTNQALALDREFMSTHPAEFIDSKGTRWIKG